ncbi:hypothetical protein T440DRAFT_204304 [Plenodomus tracheiphilus IPT5]|uniref:Polycomb protein VEFS-Box domain-containing protein n=1 Tax=Plenodomus tracheiphilus IPT5 TaxID=1408161 RepID=A0A6A7BK27_9PLEO|nr:hypothetical protein T440DRAFT_204304 [Plenodomus tracheiphilus IPT5]
MLVRRDRFCGNILLYDYLSTKRTPVFLNRNLILAFRVHQQLLLGSDVEVYPDVDYSLRSKWSPPSWDELDDMVATETANGSFVLSLESIKLNGRQQSARDSDRNARARKAQVLLRAKTSIRASFFPEASQVCRTKSTQSALLKADNRGLHGSASIDMDPFIIKHQSLAPSSIRFIAGKSYLMELRLTFLSKEEAEEFYDYMGVENIAGNPLQLVTVYDNILHCPASGRAILQLKDHTKQLAFDLEVCMWWANTVSESILERSNRALRSREERTRSYLTPPLDADRKPRLQIRFLYGDRVVQKSSLACPLDGCRVRRLVDIADLKMHLDSFHDNFRFIATQERVDDQGVQHWKFEGEIADHRADQRASGRADEPMDVHVRAPEEPFDRQLHLRGNTRFHRVATQKHPPKHSGSKGRQAASTQMPFRRRPPEAVQARPVRAKKSYIVPGAPQGITFFRSVTKQPLCAGDRISESDDELDLDWMRLRKHAEIDKEDAPEAAKRFQKIFDDFMQDENLQADIHASDAIMRFTREKGDWLFEEDILEELSSKLDESLEDGIISKDIHTACLEIVRTLRTKAQATDETLQQFSELQVEPGGMAFHPAGDQVDKQLAKRDRKGKGRAKVTNTGHLTPITADSDGDLEMREALLISDTSMQPPEPMSSQPAYDECYCGEDALNSSSVLPVIACNRVDCVRRHFHIQCVQSHTKRPLPSLNLRRRDWTCDDCKNTSSIRTSGRT